MRTQLRKIGNSQGIIIPKPFLEQIGIDSLIVRAAPQSRIGWDEAFATMAKTGDETLLDQVSALYWDKIEWEC